MVEALTGPLWPVSGESPAFASTRPTGCVRAALVLSDHLPRREMTGGTSQSVGQFVLRVATVPPYPVEAHGMDLHQGIKTLPEIDILDRLPGRCLPAVVDAGAISP